MAALRSWTLNDAPTKPLGWADMQDAATVSYDATTKRLTSWAFKGTDAARLAPLVPYSAATAPLYDPAGFNGALPALTFSTSRFDLIATATAFGVAQPATGIYVWQEPAAGRSAYEVVLDHSNGNGSSNQTLFGVYGGNTPLYVIGPGTSVQIPQGVANPLGSLNILVIEYNGVNSRIYFNGVLIGVGNNQGFNFGTSLFGIGLQIGGKKGDGPTSFGGAYCEFAIIPAIFGAGDTWDRITQGTMWKWGQQAKIASGATYKTAAPTVIDSGGPTLAAGSGAIIITGRTANLLLGHTLPAAPGALIVNGQAARVATSRRILAEPAALVLQGQGANLLHGFSLPAQAASFAVGGQPASLLNSRRVVAEPGALQLAGQGVTLARSDRLALDAGTGALIYAGQPAMLRLRRRLIAAPGAFAVTGIAAAFGQLRSLTLGAAAGAFALVGRGARPLRALRLPAGGTDLAHTGQPATLRLGLRLVAEPGGFTLTLRSATLQLGGTATPVAVPPYNCFAVPVRQRLFIVPARQRRFVFCRGASMSIVKHPSEERRYQLDWTPDLDGQEIVGKIEATSSDPALIVDRIDHKDGLMTFWLRGGTLRTVARVEFTAPTSGQEDLAWGVTVVC
ncbi:MULTISPECIES: hypothetical protein [unclassified Sphingomonas]|uniref:phage fiber-tail adaptor protein n=1 Tax=unclassified Sphingomonas TaxID=196159 RepID=UPI00226A0BE3|nr:MULTISPECIES: hypothetical protein [unclassified Sphingomonas]